MKPRLCGHTELAPVVLLNDFNRLSRMREPASLNIRSGAHSSRNHSLNYMGRLNSTVYRVKIELGVSWTPQLCRKLIQEFRLAGHHSRYWAELTNSLK